jgi:hypothetical protein
MTTRSSRLVRFPVFFKFNTGIPAAKIDLYKNPVVCLTSLKSTAITA